MDTTLLSKKKMNNLRLPDVSLLKPLLVFSAALTTAFVLVACGGGSTTGGGQATIDPAVVDPAVAIVGPGLSGNTWVGQFTTQTGVGFTELSATITQAGEIITIETTKQGIGNLLIGAIDSGGNMLLFDQFNGEDWSTLLGPATANSITIADFVFVNGVRINTNFIILKR